jgi:hypothetical protein
MRVAAWLVLFVVLTVPGGAFAQQRPWAEGVPAETQAKALKLFRLGNSLFEESKYSLALGRYREALDAWDHPAIRFNAAVALIHLDQPLIAYEHLEAALRWGAAPFEAKTHEQAQIYRKLLAGQIAELEVSCGEPGAEVLLDGERLFIGPGRVRRRLPPGPHQLAARKAGFVTEATAVNLEAGQLRREPITLRVVTAPPVKLVRRWATWVPWSVLAAGAVVGVIGVPLRISAQTQLNSFDADLARLCPSGCTESQIPRTVFSGQLSGNTENAVAIGLFAAGGALIVTGVVLLAMNTPRPEQDPSPSQVAIAPVVGPGVFGLSGLWRF